MPRSRQSGGQPWQWVCSYGSRVSERTSTTQSWRSWSCRSATRATPDGALTVVDVWESQADFDRFLASRLGPAFDKVGGMPQPDITPFHVHNTYRHGQTA